MMSLPSLWDIQANKKEVLPSAYWNQCLCSIIIQQAYKASHTYSLLATSKILYNLKQVCHFSFLMTMHFLFLLLNGRSKGATIFLFYSDLQRWRGLFINHLEVNCGVKRNLMFFPICSPAHSTGFGFNLEPFPRCESPASTSFAVCPRAFHPLVFWLHFLLSPNYSPSKGIFSARISYSVF